MNVLLVGSSGFIGTHLLAGLLDQGHRVVCAGRRAPPLADAAVTFVRRDFREHVRVEDWLPYLRGVEVVINAAGVLADDLDLVHTRGPGALFDACAAAGVARVVQISALGADARAQTSFHSTKRAADDHLRALPVAFAIVQPSLVYGRGGASAALLAGLATAPVTPLPGDGEQRIQPIHIDDAVAGILALVANGEPRGATIAFVGPRAVTLREFLAQLRGAFGLGKPRFVAVPLPLVRAAARIGKFTGRGLLNEQTLAMLERGNVADATPLRRLLGRDPRAVAELVPPATRTLDRAEAARFWLLPLLRGSLAVLWLVSGIVSLGLYPVSSSLRLLAAVGISSEPMARAALYGAAVLDIALGIAVIAMKRRRLLWAAQIAVVIGYTAIITARLPQLWLEPFGPVLKNVPVLALLCFLYATEKREWNT